MKIFEPIKGYYVYGHRDKKTGLWIYIGKGQNGRAFDNTGKSRSLEHVKYLQENDYEIIIFRDGLNEKKAFDVEEKIIKRLMEKGYTIFDSEIGYKEKMLFNKSFGGAGTKGMKLKSRARKVLCVETRKVFNSTGEAGKWAGVSCSCINGCLNGTQKKAGGYHWEEVK